MRASRHAAGMPTLLNEMTRTIDCSRDLRPFLGFGLGLRKEYYEVVLRQHPEVDWFEILTENYLVPGGKPLHYLDRVRQDYPLAMHGVSLSIGSTDPIDEHYLRSVKQLAQRIEPVWISDHLCWTGVDGFNLHDLMPLPYTEEAVEHVAGRVRMVQEFLERRILLENVSSYVSYTESTLSEWEFLAAVADRADCLILLDINNIYVNAINHAFDPRHYIDKMPAQRVWQFHVAGHRNLRTHIIDTHDEPVCESVWDLYSYACEKLGLVSAMIERDDQMPPFDELLHELELLRTLASSARVRSAFPA